MGDGTSAAGGLSHVDQPEASTMTVSESSSVFEPSSLATAAMPRDAERDEFSELDTSSGSCRLSYVSLHEHMLRHSLRRTLRMRDYRAAGSIICGWACNWL